MAFDLRFIPERRHESRNNLKTKRTLASLRRFLPSLVVFAVATGLGVRLFLLISKYSVNLPFWDQRDLHRALFEKAPLWRLFLWQHGPHRQGIGFVLDKFLFELTDWSTRAEAFFIGGVIFIAMLLALLLKRKLFGGSLGTSDALIPMIFLTPAQWETFIVAPNPSLAAFPLLLIMLYCLAWLQANPLKKYGTVLLLNLFLIYTGFGLFIGLITVAHLALECFKGSRREARLSAAPALALILGVGSFFSFFLDYTWNPAVDCFSFPHP